MRTKLRSFGFTDSAMCIETVSMKLIIQFIKIMWIKSKNGTFYNLKHVVLYEIIYEIISRRRIVLKLIIKQTILQIILYTSYKHTTTV